MLNKKTLLILGGGVALYLIGKNQGWWGAKKTNGNGTSSFGGRTLGVKPGSRIGTCTCRYSEWCSPVGSTYNTNNGQCADGYVFSGGTTR